MKSLSPAYSFTVPSIHDDTPLDCRIYHPSGGAEYALSARKGAILAHPYAPLGGCFDDHVVESLAEQLADDGFVVGTFNFRGAGASKSKTSWSGKGELDDYISVAGFLITYLSRLSAPSSVPSPTRTEALAQSDITTAAAAATQPDRNLPANPSESRDVLLIFGGYSYGSLVVQNLPTAESIVARFNDAKKGSAAAEIVLRAKVFAAQTSRESEATSSRGRQLSVPGANTQGHHLHNSQHPSPVMIGGEETPSDERRRSRDTRPSGERLRSLDIPRSIAHKTFRRKSGEASGRRHGAAADSIHEHIPTPLAAYLLVSPLQPPLTSALATALGRGWGAKQRDAQDVLLTNPTMAVWGSEDFFTSSRRLNSWADKMAGESAGKFRRAEVRGGGHFWREAGMIKQLCDAVGNWVSGLG